MCVSYSILHAISSKKFLNHIVQVFFLRLLTKVVLIIWQQPLRDLIIKNNKKLAPNNPSKNTFHQGFRKKVDARFFAEKGSQHFFMSKLDIMAKC